MVKWLARKNWLSMGNLLWRILKRRMLRILIVFCVSDLRLVRGSKCFSKLKRHLVCSVELFKFYWNFINEFKHEFSPAKLEGLTNHLWTWHDFFLLQQIIIKSQSGHCRKFNCNSVLSMKILTVLTEKPILDNVKNE